MNLIVFLILASVLSASLAGQEQKPNVLFILADDLGINALHCYGNERVESPNIDRLAASGMRFTNGYSSDPTCAPSRASIMSGQDVPRHEVYRVSDRYLQRGGTLENMRYLPPERGRPDGKKVGMSPTKITLAEAMKSGGYRTGGFGKWHLGDDEMGMEAQGFDIGVETTKHFGFRTNPRQEDVLDKEYNADYTTRRGIEFMRRSVEEGDPFFLYLPYYLVHKPLEPKPEVFAYFNEKYAGELDQEVIQVLAMIKSLDDSVGELLSALEDLGIGQETIIVFASDNGHYGVKDNFFNQPYRGEKGQTYEGGIRVPYLFKWPGHIAEGSISTEPILHTDVYPTVLGLTATETPEDYPLDGVSIAPLLTGVTDTTARDALIWQYTNYAGYNEKRQEFRSEWVNVIHADNYKMTEIVESGNYILYNLKEDPYETKDIAALRPQVISHLRSRLNEWKRKTGAKQPRPNPDYRGKEDRGAVREPDPFRTENLIPWSIVAFDVKERGPAERIAMIKRLGFTRYAFGGREQHIATMATELALAKEEGVEISAVWLYVHPEKDAPGKLKPMSEQVFTALEETKTETQIWVGFHPDYVAGLTEEAALTKAVSMVDYLSERAENLGCRVALYNHGGWMGRAEHQLAIINALPARDLGIVFNFHHAHDQLDNYSETIRSVLPYLRCVSLNGMKAGGPKIITIGEGELEENMVRELLDLGYTGPYTLLGHVKGGDAEEILRQNLAGLQKLTN